MAGYSLFVLFLVVIFAATMRVVTSNILMVIAGLSVATASITALVAGLAAIIKRKERSVLVFLSVVFGVVVGWIVVGSIFVDLLGVG